MSPCQIIRPFTDRARVGDQSHMNRGLADCSVGRSGLQLTSGRTE